MRELCNNLKLAPRQATTKITSFSTVVFFLKQSETAVTMRNLYNDQNHYLKAFHVFLKNSTEHQCMQEFIEKKLPGMLSR